MDRFVWTSGLLEINETLVIQQRGVRVYDGEEKVGRKPPRPADPRAGLGTAWSSALGSRPRPRGPRCTVDCGAGARGTGGGGGDRSPGRSSSAWSGSRPRNAFRHPPAGWMGDGFVLVSPERISVGGSRVQPLLALWTHAVSSAL